MEILRVVITGLQSSEMRKNQQQQQQQQQQQHGLPPFCKFFGVSLVNERSVKADLQHDV